VISANNFFLLVREEIVNILRMLFLITQLEF